MVEKLFRRAKNAAVQEVTCGRVKQILEDQQSYSRHKQARCRFNRYPTYFKGNDAQCQEDLADMQPLILDMKGHKFVKTLIEIFSKRVWAIPARISGEGDAHRLPKAIQRSAVGWKNFVSAFLSVCMNVHAALGKMHLRNFIIQSQSCRTVGQLALDRKIT